MISTPASLFNDGATDADFWDNLRRKGQAILNRICFWRY